VAETIERVYSDALEDHYSELAYQYSRSVNTGKALEYLRLAGLQAVASSSHADAIARFTSAVELLKGLPETPQRMEQELSLQLNLGLSLNGWSAPEAGQAYGRALELCRQNGTNARLGRVFVSLASYYQVRAVTRQRPLSFNQIVESTRIIFG
jgi:predicted ATPase